MALRLQTVQSTLFRPLFELGAALGLERERLVAATGASQEQLASPDARLSYDALRQLWELLVAERGGEPLGVRLAEHAEPTHFGLVGYVTVNSPDLRTALTRYCRVVALLDPRTEWRLSDTPTGGRVELRLDAWGQRLRHPAEGLLAAQVASGRVLSGTHWSPRRVCFAHPRHAASEAVEAFFGTRVEYDAAAYVLETDAAVLALPVAHADIALGNLLHARAEAALAEAHASGERPWRERVTELLAAQPRTGELGPEGVAARLAVSERTLQRRLREEGVSFAGLEEEVRRGRAFELLRDGQLALFEVAFLLGFSDPSAFSRAFRRWSGMAPVAWQRAQASADDI
jgi:AraC-like DNA-binding protein